MRILLVSIYDGDCQFSVYYDGIVYLKDYCLDECRLDKDKISSDILFLYQHFDFEMFLKKLYEDFSYFDSIFVCEDGTIEVVKRGLL